MNKLEEDKISIVNTALSLGFENKTFLITGATGMIGTNIVASLRNITEDKNIIVLGKTIEEAKNTFSNTGVMFSSFEKLSAIDKNIDYIIHLASPTSSKYLTDCPVETINFIYSSTKSVLEFAMRHKSKVLYISSMEVYGEVYDETKRNEHELGYISLNSTRSSYPEAKRLCELLCYSYFKEYDLDVCCARLSQTFGAGTSVNDPRVFGYFARCVKEKKDIVLKTKGDSIGNYCYLSDTIRALFYIFARGKSGETYNVSGDNSRSSIYDLACMVAKDFANGQIKVLVDLDLNSVYPNSTKLNMSNLKLKKLGWRPDYNLKDMFERMIS